MPKLRFPASLSGTKAVAATVKRWLKNPGDLLAKGDLLVELEVDEALIHIEAAGAGTLGTILAGAGVTIALGGDLAELSDAPAPVTTPSATQSTPSQNKAPAMSNSSAPSGPVTPVLMPQAGNSMEEGTVLKWRVKVGDQIALGQILYEVETDKATVEVEATDAGRLARIVAPEGTVVPVKQPVAFLAASDADVDAYLGGSREAVAETTATQVVEETRNSKLETRSESAVSAPASRTESGRVKASPAARKIAAERGVDLASVGAGSGPEGRILSTDVASAKAGARLAKPASSPAAGPGGVIRRPMSKMRKAIATNLQVSKQTVPHFYVTLTIHADPLFAFYRAQKPATGCTLNDVVLLAVGKTVGEFSAFRSRIDGNDIVEHPAANIGVAVSVEDGLVVPVVLNIERLTLAQLAAESKRVVESARNGKIENMGKGVFTISNMGMLGVEDFSAIINPPESGILAISAVRESVLVKDGAIKAGRVMTMTLSVDHRVVDGALAAQFMAKLKVLLESPEQLIG